MKQVTLGLISAIGLSGCVLDEIGGVSRGAVYDARSVDEVIALGGVRLTEAEIVDAFAGQDLIEPNEAWTWTINEDYTHHAADDNGEWADAPGGIWQIVNDQFCRENEELALKCSDVYQIGKFYRFTETDGSLAVWTVTQG